MRKIILPAIVLVALVNLSSGLTVECDFKVLHFRHKHGDFYTCQTVGLESTEDDNYISEIISDHHAGKTDKDVTQFYVHNQSAEYFPSGLSKRFPNLEAINIRHAGLKYIFYTDLLGLDKLKYFSLADNEIEILGPKLFEDNPNLLEIHFERNLITSISGDLLDSLEEPKVVHFYENFCIKEDLDHKIYNLNDVKENLKKLCAFNHEDRDEISTKLIAKLSTQIETLDDMVSDEKVEFAAVQAENMKLNERISKSGASALSTLSVGVAFALIMNVCYMIASC